MWRSLLLAISSQAEPLCVTFWLFLPERPGEPVKDAAVQGLTVVSSRDQVCDPTRNCLVQQNPLPRKTGPSLAFVVAVLVLFGLLWFGKGSLSAVQLPNGEWMGCPLEVPVCQSFQEVTSSPSAAAQAGLPGSPHRLPGAQGSLGTSQLWWEGRLAQLRCFKDSHLQRTDSALLSSVSGTHTHSAASTEARSELCWGPEAQDPRDPRSQPMGHCPASGSLPLPCP